MIFPIKLRVDSYYWHVHRLKKYIIINQCITNTASLHANFVIKNRTINNIYPLIP